MSDEIRQPRNVGMITPLSRTRNSGQRKKPRNKVPAKPEADKRRRRPADDQSHHVDEYV